MRLVKLTLAGYKRFGEKTPVNLDGKLIALVGPNEAGKTTILQALTRMVDESPISPRERTRPSEPAETDVAIESLWLLELDDLVGVEVPQGSEPPRWLTIGHTMGGELKRTLNPMLRRDREPRRRLAETLEQAKSSKWLSVLDEADGDFRLANLDETIKELGPDPATLPKATIDGLHTLIGQLAPAIGEAPKYAENLPERIQSVIDHETAEHPNTAAINLVWSRLPPVLIFDLSARELSSSYDLVQVTDQPTPTALANLSNVAELDLHRLRGLVEVDDRAAAEEVLDAANARLNERLARAWGQSIVETRLTREDFVLRIYVRTEKGGLQEIAERSDGLRAFLALVAFTSELPDNRLPILLVDEAEIHLHYDAQADLVQMLERQQQARQVIYTTHSAGCLPPDIGTGVRLIEQVPPGDRSRVENWPWAVGSGFDPLLLGMGASTMAFVPTRAAVIGEGAGEVVLLPTLLREATKQESLEFQVAPGAAEASKETIGLVNLQGNRVAWLVDGDRGGRDNGSHLRSSGIPEERIIVLGGAGSGLAVEDLVDIHVYVAAVNEELRRSGGDAAAVLTIEVVGAVGRPSAIEKWCSERGIAAPNKGAVAHRIADQRSERSLIDPERADLLRELHEAITELLTPPEGTP
jgi:predicted ATP-dependent endonuclease of OLD family